MICPKCNAKNADIELYCKNCGQDMQILLGGSSTPTAPQEEVSIPIEVPKEESVASQPPELEIPKEEKVEISLDLPKEESYFLKDDTIEIKSPDDIKPTKFEYEE